MLERTEEIKLLKKDLSLSKIQFYSDNEGENCKVQLASYLS